MYICMCIYIYIVYVCINMDGWWIIDTCKWGMIRFYSTGYIYIYTVKPASWHQAQENMNERCNLLQLNALFAEGKTHVPWAQKLGSWATNFNILAPLFGSRIRPLFWGHKTQTGAIQYGQQVCYCRHKLTAAHIRDTPRVHAWEACFTTSLRLWFWGLEPT